MNKKRVKELREFVKVSFPERVGDKGFFRTVKKMFVASNKG